MSLNNSILVKLGLSTTQFNQGLSQSQRRARSFASGASRAFSSIVGPVLAIGTVMALGRAALKIGDDIDRASQKVGVGVEDLQKLGYAAKQSKADFETLERGLEGMNQRLGKTPEKFEKYGIAVKNADGTTKSSAEVFSLVAERVKNAGTAAEQTAIAQDLMGRAGRDLLPTLKLGADGLQEMGSKAEELSQVMSEDTVKSLAAATQIIDDFKTSSTIAFAKALGGAKDLYDFMSGKGLNEDHQKTIDLKKKAEAQLLNAGVIRSGKTGRKYAEGDEGKSWKESRAEAQLLIQDRMNQLTRENLKTGIEEAKNKDLAAKEEMKLAEKKAVVEADNAAIKEDDLEVEKQTKEIAAKGLTIAQRHAQVMKERADEALPAAEKLLKYEEQLAALNDTDDTLLDDKERERIVREILSLEDKIFAIRNQDIAPEEEEKEEEAEQLTRDFFGKEYNVAELRKTMEEDEDGKTVAGRNARDLLAKGVFFDKKEGIKEAKDQLAELQEIRKSLQGKFTNQ